ncbi:MAG: T9SS type A sorting domain-containing protein, partial [Chitinophagaceae bacterium]|nr:T9SS type A sorting domain-containing protein [Chitinophagaceae bacterium]
EGPIAGSRLSPWGTPAITSTRARSFQEAMMETVQGFSLRATPNPSSNHFTLFTKSDRKETITLTITDVMGRIIERRQNIAANGTVEFGNKYRSGLYFVEVRQGEKKQILKLIRK